MRKHRRILIVEDSDTQAFKLGAVLKEAGFDSDRTSTAEAAMEYLRSKRPDLIIIDYHLPGMSGAEFCRRVRMRAGLEAITILMLTGDAEKGIERQGLESGADDYVRKSADNDILIARVEALLRKAKTQSPLAAAPEDYFRSQTILIVDDSPTYIVFLENALEEEGYRILSTTHPEMALEFIEERYSNGLAAPDADGSSGHIDCVVLDLVMPGIDGIELCRRINDMRRLGHLSLPILMVTSHDSKDEMMRALETGADDFVRKSNDTVILKARIRALLRRKILHDEHERILAEFRNKELEVVQARAEQQAAQARATLVEELECANENLKRTQAQLVQSAKMASLGSLVAGIAHEINNPLAYSLGHLRTITNLCKTIAADAEKEWLEEGKQKLDKIQKRACDAIEGLERVAELIVKLRTFSRLDEGEFKNADIRDCIESALPLIRHRILDKINIKTQYAKDNKIFCAPGMLNQVIMNLITNAIDAIDGAGEICISTQREKNTFCISVADTGPGIAENILDRLFEPFFTTKDVGKGTGLGLAISYQVIETHHGRIEARNNKEGGAEFIIHLPTNLAEYSHASSPAA